MSVIHVDLATLAVQQFFDALGPGDRLTYAGVELRSNRDYFWTVQVWHEAEAIYHLGSGKYIFTFAV